jgi:hypothetical protein
LTTKEISKEVRFRIYNITTYQGLNFGEPDIVSNTLDGRQFKSFKEFEDALYDENKRDIFIHHIDDTALLLNKKQKESGNRVELQIKPAKKLKKKDRQFNMILLYTNHGSTFIVQKIYTFVREYIDEAKKILTMDIPMKYLYSVRKQLEKEMMAYFYEVVSLEDNKPMQIFELFDSDKPYKFKNALEMYQYLRKKSSGIIQIKSVNKYMKSVDIKITDKDIIVSPDFREYKDKINFNLMLLVEKDKDNECVHIVSYRTLPMPVDANNNITYHISIL